MRAEIEHLQQYLDPPRSTRYAASKP